MWLYGYIFLLSNMSDYHSLCHISVIMIDPLCVGTHDGVSISFAVVGS